MPSHQVLHNPATLPALLVACLIAAIAGCDTQPTTGVGVITQASGEQLVGSAAGLDPAGIIAALGPARLRIHPLSRLERDGAGKLRLIAHLELADRYSHTAKWLGLARVELYRPGERARDDANTAISGDERQDAVWIVQLNEPDRNAELYDWVTRTYVLPLGELPDWVDALEQGRSGEPWLTLRAYFTTIDASGRERVLKAELRVRRDGAN